jgi:hypothetical protein
MSLIGESFPALRLVGAPLAGKTFDLFVGGDVRHPC